MDHPTNRRPSRPDTAPALPGAAAGVLPGTVSNDEPRPSQSQIAYERLREKIIMLELQPGERLVELQLIAELGIGRTPLREAIQRLVQYGLVVAPPRQSAFVAPIQAFEIAEIVEVREILERSSARLAASRATAKDIRALRDASDRFDECMEDGNTRDIVLADTRFHDTLALAAHNNHLRQSIAWNRDYGGRLWCLSVSRGGPMPPADYSHTPIVDAVKAKDPEAAERAISAHIGLFRMRLQRMITEVTPEGPRL